MNHIQRLTEERDELRKRVDAADEAIRSFRVHITSSKFTGNPDSPLHGYISVKDVDARLNIIDTCLYNL